MNIARHMEAIFVVAIALVGITSFATAAVPAQRPANAAAAAPFEGKMQVVTITAKRLTAAEKSRIAQ
jgi:hypothetical protein